MLALLVLVTIQHPVRPDTLTLTMADAVSRALVVSPSVAVAVGDVARVRGLRAETLLPFPTNPGVFYGQTERTTATSTTQDYDWLISQELEIGGQSFTRRSAMTAFLRASEARVEDSRRLTALETRLAFLTLALAQRQEALIDTTARFAERMVGFAQRQFDAGEINRLELNASILDAARTRSAAERARFVTEAAAAELARVVAVSPDTAVRAISLPSLPDIAWIAMADPLQLARSRRPDLLAAEAQLQGAGSALSAAKRAFIPNLTFAALGGQEGGPTTSSAGRSGCKCRSSTMDRPRGGRLRPSSPPPMQRGRRRSVPSRRSSRRGLPGWYAPQRPSATSRTVC